MVAEIEKARPLKILRELGVSGLRRWDTKVEEEFLPELRGERGRRTLWQMGDCDPTLSAILYIYRSLMKACDWEVRASPLDSSDLSKKATKFVDECINDMSSSWESTAANFTSFLQYGFAVHEIVFKQRLGPDARVPSAYSDGKVGIHKLPGRSQRTIFEWKFDGHGGVEGCFQEDVQRSKTIWLPIEKFLLFRTEEDNWNPEGKSILASSYLPWYFLRNFRELQGIGVERDITGIPIITLPAEMFTNSEFATELANYQNLISNIRVDEMDGVLLPHDNNNPELYKLTLLASPGKKNYDIDKIIETLKLEMTSATLTDLMFLGHSSGGGSYALSRTKQEALNIAVFGFLSSEAAVINRHLIPKLIKVNSEFSGLTHYPEIYPKMKRLPNYQELSELIRALAFSSFHVSAKPEILNSVLENYGLPLLSSEEYDELASNTTDYKILPGGGKYLSGNEEVDSDEDLGEADSLSIEPKQD